MFACVGLSIITKNLGIYFPAQNYLLAFNFPGVIETCSSDGDVWLHRHLQR
jgi:hypothetical protein